MSDYSEPARFERYRLMVISTWPDNEHKAAALASVRAALQRQQAVMQSRVGDEPVFPRRAA